MYILMNMKKFNAKTLRRKEGKKNKSFFEFVFLDEECVTKVKDVA